MVNVCTRCFALQHCEFNITMSSVLLQEAEKAKAFLHGKKALGKKIIVDWAKQDQGASKKNVSIIMQFYAVRYVL